MAIKRLGDPVGGRTLRPPPFPLRPILFCKKNLLGYHVKFNKKNPAFSLKIYAGQTGFRCIIRGCCATIDHDADTNDRDMRTDAAEGETAMGQSAGYFIVEASAMPEIFRKVAEAKRLLETGEETTVNGAARAVGISRSAFYKYKDAVRPFNDMLHGRIVTFQTLLRDEPGILSGLLNVFAGTGVNILTINQNIPTNGCAVVTITAETSALRRTLEEMLEAAASSPGVLKCEILAG